MCAAMDTCVSREEFEEFCDKQYPHDAAMKTMRRAKMERISCFLKGELDAVPLGSWRYRIQDKGYTLANFPALGLKEVLCLKGVPHEGRIELGFYGEWRKVVPVEDFYDVLIDAHVRIQMHGGYKKLLGALEVNYVGVPREAAAKFVNLCSVCQSNPRQQRQRTAKATAANISRERVVKLSCITRDFNRRCQVDLMDMSESADGDYTHIGVYTDHWTKFTTLFPMMGGSPQHIAYGLVSSVFPYYGPPQFLHCTEGKEFATEVIRLTMEKWKGGERTVVPQPKPGLMHLGEVVEATRDTIIKMINSRAEMDGIEAPIPWAGWLGKIMLDINNQINTNTGKSPYNRVFERRIGATDSDEVEVPVTDYAVHGQKHSASSGVKLNVKKKKSNSPDDGNAAVIITSFKSPRPVGAVKLPQTFVSIEKQS